MGKIAKARRSAEKKRQKTNAKLTRLAEYERKRGQGKQKKNAKAKKGARVRDDRCMNIGDAKSYPDVLETLVSNFKMYHGMKFLGVPGYQNQNHTKYKGALRELLTQRDLNRRPPVAVKKHI